MSAAVGAVLFDFAGTLFDDRALRDAHLEQLRFVADAAGVAADDAALRAAYRVGMSTAYRTVACAPAYSHRALFAAAFVATAEALGGHIDEGTAQEAVDRQYRATIEQAPLRDGCIETLRALSDAGVHVQIVSNIDDEQLHPMIDRFGIRALLSAITSSESAGACKPDPAIYAVALQRAGIAAEHVLFVGDSAAHDVVGPAAAGMRTAWLTSRPDGDTGSVRPDHVITSLTDVLAIVGIDRSDGDEHGCLSRFLDDVCGDVLPITVEPMRGGGSCEVFALERGEQRWVLRRAPRHASSSTAHDVLREHRILDAIKDERVRIARPIAACADPAVFGAAFYVMQRIDGVPIRQKVPDDWASAPATHGRALEELIDALAEIHLIDWRACGLGEMAPRADDYLGHQLTKWLDQLGSYGGRDLPAARATATWLERHRPPQQPLALCHGDYKLDNVLFAPETPPRLLAVVDWEMAAIGDPLVDLGWALIFHPGPEGTMHLGMTAEPRFAVEHLPSKADLVARYAARTGRDTSHMDWYDVFSRWKLAIVLEGSFAKFQRGLSDKPMHAHFGPQADLLLASANDIVERSRP